MKNNRSEKGFTRMVSTLFYLRGAKKNKQTGLTPIYLRITIKGKRQDVSMKRWIQPLHWDSKSQKAKGNKEEAKILNCFLNGKINEVHKHYNTLHLAGQIPTTELIVNMLKGVAVKKYTLLEVYEFYNSKFKEDVSIGKYTAIRLEKHEINLRKIKSFLQFKYRVRDIDIEKLDVEFINNYEFYLRTEDKHQHNTAIGYCKALKAVGRMAYRKKWLDRHPFEDWQGVFVDTHRPFLTAEELARVEAKKFTLERLELVKDIFIFSCYTGLAFVDVCKLTSANIIVGMDKKMWLSVYREKTDAPINFPLLSSVKAIIEKYKNHPVCLNNGKLLPLYAHQTTNSYLKEIATLCDIDKEISFHAGRHTFATTVALANGVPMETVARMLGHANQRTTKIYAKIGDAKMSADMEALDKKIENHKNSSKKPSKIIDLVQFDPIISSN